jgi:hypothetical protein
MTTPLVLICTPAYGGMVHTDYVASLLAFKDADIAFGHLTIGNESLISRARNTLAAGFLARSEFTHLLFLDGDVKLPPEGLRRMLAHDKDIIGAPVALKGRNPDGSRIFNIGKVIGEEGLLICADRIGTAALMFSRKAIQALADDAIAQGFAYQRNPHARGASDPAVHYDVFRVGVRNGEYLSEDYWACLTAVKLGFKVYVDPTIVTEHHGTVAV